jgi:hypothetical protein
MYKLRLAATVQVRCQAQVPAVERAAVCCEMLLIALQQYVMAGPTARFNSGGST